MTFMLRRATPDDAPAITRLRRLMFEAMGHRDAAQLDAMEAQFLPWVKDKTARGEFLTWLMVDDNDVAVAGASLWIRETVPSPNNLSGREGLVLNVSTHPDYRRRGFARQLLEALLDWSREHDLHTLLLVATPEGKSLYASLGFQARDFMLRRLGE
jgi:N-acetylglutamate synthase-like GNAT family acetyltransferase